LPAINFLPADAFIRHRLEAFSPKHLIGSSLLAFASVGLEASIALTDKSDCSKTVNGIIETSLRFRLSAVPLEIKSECWD
jgi:type IV secretory pathway TraG/TraD family ATPase VirD4